MNWRGARVLTVVVAGGWLACLTPPALARDAVVTSFDGTAILAHFSPATNRAANERVPTVLVGPGFLATGDVNYDRDTSDNIGQATLRAAGYNVLTWDPRGVGGSGGVVMFDSPDFEARDVQALIDFVGRQPEALLDAPNDPRVGMSGSSYGGAIQLATAAIDGRVDALVTDSAWNSLATGFFPDGKLKAGWFSRICGSDQGMGGLPANLLGPAAAVLIRADSHLTTACLESIGGSLSPASRQWFVDRTPPGLRDRVNAPTLITHGTVDTLLGLDEAIANYDVLRAKGVPVKMMWQCGGHGVCTTSKGEPGRVRRAGLAWLDRWLKRNASADTGAGFEWLADDGVWRSGPQYPLGSAGTIDASAASLPSLGVSLLDSAQSGTITAATPARNAIDVAFSTPPAGSDVVGPPSVKMTYKGNATSPNTYLFAQILDTGANRVIGSQVTPIPVILDNRVRSVEKHLQPIVVHAGAGSSYRLQITPGTAVFSAQGSVGGVAVQQVVASLPLVDPSRSASALRTPRRLRVTVSSRRAGAVARVLIRTRLRTKPCAGSVTFTVTVADRRQRHRVRVPSGCTVEKVLRLRVRTGTRIRVSSTFDGNAALEPRAARTITYRVR